MKGNNKNKEQLIKELEELRLENKSLRLLASESGVTRLGQIGQTLPEKENLYDESLIQLRDVIFLLSSQGMIVSLNEAFEKITGWTRQEWIGKPFANLLHQEDIQLGQERLLNIMNGHISDAIELRIRKKSGDYLYGEILATPWIKNKKPAGLVGVGRDITKRKKAEEKLSVSENKFSKLFHSSPDAILLTELKSGIIIEVNASFVKFSGYSSEELIGHPVLEFNMYGPAERQRFVSMLREKGKIHNVEFVLKNKAGKELHVLSSAEIIEIEGEPHTITILKDITESKRAEEALRESEERFKTLSFLGNEGLMIHEEGIILDANKAFASLLGYSSPDGLIGKNGLEVVKLTPKSKKVVIDHMRNNLNDTYDIEIINVNGKVIPAETKGTEIVYMGHKARLVYMRDITKRKIDEEALAESKALLASIIDSTNDLIWSIDVDRYRLLTFNKGLKIFFEQEGIQIREGMLLEDILPSELVKKLSQLYSQTLQEGSLITMYQTTIGNRTLWINLHLLSQKNKPYAISAFAKDITELMQAQEALIQAKEKAEESDRLKTAFMNNISHEVRTPLNGILGFAQIILKPDIKEDEKEIYLDILNTSSERLLNTITDYMDISLLVSGNLQVHKQSISLSELLNEIYDKFQPKCAAKNLELIKQFPSTTKYYPFFCDALLLEKSISHLVDNAIKFTQSGTIILGLRLFGSEYEIYIKDTGSGISQEAQDKIFDYFRQEVISSTRGYEGSGLGLSISKGMVELMGGKIRVESIKGEGSTFFIAFPAEPGIIKNIESSNINDKKSRSSISPVILIAEDDKSNFEFFKTILERTSFKYLHAINGIETVEMCRNHPEISIVLMDIKLPLMDGLEATQKIREFKKDLPIIGVTAYAMTGDREKVLNAGCNDYIAKPIESDKLIKLIKKHLEIL
jgi:PAS domain S-box-containing protein